MCTFSDHGVASFVITASTVGVATIIGSPSLAIMLLLSFAVLQAVTDEGGTARRAQIPLYHVGGKTGTTMKYVDGSYASRRYISSFVGLAPIGNPRFVMAITVDDPRSQQYYGGQIAAPVFADVMDDVMRIYDIAPDKIDQSMLVQRNN